ncbi:hypothetical protein D3H59_15585 [Micromonospora endophytica]|nr:hypothetical protein D3H59_15585 [Micromonospora endophytica]
MTTRKASPEVIADEPADTRKATGRKVVAKKAAAAPAKATRARKATNPAEGTTQPQPSETHRSTAGTQPDETHQSRAGTQPGETHQSRAETQPDETQRSTAEAELRALLARVLDHPGFAPELLALTAVETLGPRAGVWARRLREIYPLADGDGLARLATRRFVRQAAVGGAGAAFAGAFAPVVELAVVLWSQANLVLHVAAAYDRDPAHPERAAELLVLAQVHPDLTSARTALAAARTADGPSEAPGPRAAEAAWRLAAPLTAQAGGWLALRLVSRLLPGAAPLAAAAGDAAAAQRLAARATATYRPPRPPSPPRG